MYKIVTYDINYEILWNPFWPIQQIFHSTTYRWILTSFNPCITYTILVTRENWGQFLSNRFWLVSYKQSVPLSLFYLQLTFSRMFLRGSDLNVALAISWILTKNMPFDRSGWTLPSKSIWKNVRILRKKCLTAIFNRGRCVRAKVNCIDVVWRRGAGFYYISKMTI